MITSQQDEANGPICAINFQAMNNISVEMYIEDDVVLTNDLPTFRVILL